LMADEDEDEEEDIDDWWQERSFRTIWI
jgi:hypothetical protein